jgi:hypothetical protein
MRERYANAESCAVAQSVTRSGSALVAFSVAITYAKPIAGSEPLTSHLPLALHGTVTCVFLDASTSTCAFAGAGSFAGGKSFTCPVLMAFTRTVTCRGPLTLACPLAITPSNTPADQQHCYKPHPCDASMK